MINHSTGLYNINCSHFIDKGHPFNAVRGWERVVSKMLWSIKPSVEGLAQRGIAKGLAQRGTPKGLAGRSTSEESHPLKKNKIVEYRVNHRLVKLLRSGTLTRYQSLKLEYPDYKKQGIPKVNGKGFSKFLISPPDQILDDYVVIVFE